jgi:ribosomal protein S18 acetylase RimI-like enzyme
LTAADLAALHDLEAAAYEPALRVSDDAFLRLIALYPEGAVGCFDEGVLCGYAFGVPLPAGTILDLRAPLGGIPANADTFYIHDVTVAERCRGRGLGTRLTVRLLDLARASGLGRAELVSVDGAEDFWSRFGFRTVREFEYAPGVLSRQMTAAL